MHRETRRGTFDMKVVIRLHVVVIVVTMTETALDVFDILFRKKLL